MSHQTLKITTLTLGQLSTNCYLLSCAETGDSFIVDPADSGETINQTLLEQQLTPRGIIITHGHFDHCLGLLETQTAWDIPAWLHPLDQPLIAKAQKSAEFWLKQPADPIPQPTHELLDNQLLTLGKTTLQIWHTPGHTPGSICIVHPEAVFTGDTVFAEGVGRTDHKYSSKKQLYASLARLKELAPSTRLYPGHGPDVPLADTVLG